MQPHQASILASPFLTLNVVDTALDAETNPTVRVQLLSAKVHLLETARETERASTEDADHPADAAGSPAAPAAAAAAAGPSPSPSPSPSLRLARVPDPTPLLSARILLADAYLALVPPNLVAAEAVCGAVEDECKRLMKRARMRAAPAWMGDVPRLRVRGLRVLARVEERLGRGARAERSRKLADEIAAG
ncbi:unnamed protein product [Cutaneotrichosporon oleaginosum]